MNKLSRVLSNTPTRRVDVIKTPFKSLSPKVQQKFATNIVPYNIISEETTKLAATFYEENSISRVMLGKDNVISVANNNGTKMKKRKRLLLGDISKIHKKYLEKHPENSIGKSSFLSYNHYG